MTNLDISSHSSFMIPHFLFEKEVVHLNIVGFKAAVAAANDRALRERPFVVAGATGDRALALDCSAEAIRQGIRPGMTLAAARRQVGGLLVLPIDFPAYEKANRELETLAARYAPAWENDRAGNIYLDITGTKGLFGPPADCSSRILREILEKTGIRPAAAVACNKLVSKVATRTIRPSGLIQVQAGTEAEFLARQDIRILPGMGPGLLRTAAVTGIREIGEIAALSETEALALFGKQGPLLRRMASGIDSSVVENHDGRKRITQKLDFNEDTIDETAIRAALISLSERGGLEMRNEKLGTRLLRLEVMYSDGVEVQGARKSKGLLVTHNEIMAEVFYLYRRIVNRRIRIRSMSLCFEDFFHLEYQPDLFEPVSASVHDLAMRTGESYSGETKDRKLQEAIDKIRNRYGIKAVTQGVRLAVL